MFRDDSLIAGAAVQTGKKTSGGSRVSGRTFFIITMVVTLIIFGYAILDRAEDTASDEAYLGEKTGDPPVMVRSQLNVWTGESWRSLVDAPAQTPEELLAQLSGIADAAPGSYGVYIYELDTNQGFGINEDQRFEAASTNKIPILIKLFREIELGNIARTQELTYLSSDFEGGTGSIQNTGPSGSWTVVQLAELMIRESDNIAKNMLFRLLGYGQVEAFARGHGSDFDVYYNQVSPRGMAILLQQMYKGGIVNQELSQEMIGMMIDTAYEDRLPRYLDEVPVANKVGTWGDAVSDVGIVLHDEHPFVIAVYSEDTGSEADAADAIAMMAALTYAYEVNR